MANSKRGESELEIGGRLLKLKFNINSIAEMEEDTGMSVNSMFHEDRVGVHTIRKLLFHGLKWQNRRLKIDDVGDLMEPDKLGYYAEQVGKSINLAMGGKEEPEEEEGETDPLGELLSENQEK